jgi:exonuclease SbcC
MLGDTPTPRWPRAASQRVTRADTRLQGAETVAKAVAKLPELQRALKSAEADLAREEETLEAVRAKRAAGTEVRLEEALGTLVTISDLRLGGDTDAAPDMAEARLLADAEQVRLAQALPVELKAQAERVAEFAGRRRAAEEALRTAETLASRAQDVASAREEAAAARADMHAAAERRQAAGAAAEAAAWSRDKSREALRLLSEELASVEPRAAKAAPLDRAEARLAELEPQAAAAQAEIARLTRELALLPEADDLPPEPDVAGAKHKALSAEEALTEARLQVASIEHARNQARASAERLAALEAERVAAEAELSDWTRIASDVGRDGLQAMVIDQAIPELNETANDLLHVAFGPRFTVEVRTQAADAKGRRLLETLDVWVIDTGTPQHKGREGLAETFSGGEKTILAEALSLALTKLACRLSGAERPTLIRDESAGQLSEGNAPIWISMLRRAADLIDVDRILFVNHDRQTWDLADARIWVGAQA